MVLTLLPDLFSISRVEGNAALSDLPAESVFVSATRTSKELSIICRDRDAPASDDRSQGWRCLEIAGPLDLQEVGILSSLTALIENAGIPIIVTSTYDTDYIFVQSANIASALTVLREAGHGII